MNREQQTGFVCRRCGQTYSEDVYGRRSCYDPSAPGAGGFVCGGTLVEVGDATPPATPEPRELPRRCYVDQWTPAERAIQAAVAVVESMGADVRLSWAVSLLSDARRKVADFVDGVQVAIEDDEPSSVPEGTGATWQPPLRSPVSQPPATPEPPEGERAGERAIGHRYRPS